MIDVLKSNIETEINILREISNYSLEEKSADKAQIILINGAIESLKKSMRIINDSIPELMKNLSVAERLSNKSIKTNLENLTVKKNDKNINVALKKNDREKFLKELSITENLIKKIKKHEIKYFEISEEFKASRGYLKLSNKFFLEISSDLAKKGYFRQLYGEIKRANIDVLFETYIAMIFFTTVISVFVGIGLLLFLTFFEISFIFPWISAYDGNYAFRILKLSWLIIAVPVITFASLYFYPSTERDSLSKKINQELPFAVIHMSAISGSQIAPVEIFRIIGSSNDYPNLKKEIRKVLNQINIYGYDLVTALGNVSKSTPSQKLSELFNGLSTTINSGGDLTEFFQKRSETLLVDYRLEREKFNRLTETFMDIYISVVIATPMILMLLLIMISLTGIQTGFSTTQLTIMIISVVALVNIIFLGFLRIKQPQY